MAGYKPYKRRHEEVVAVEKTLTNVETNALGRSLVKEFVKFDAKDKEDAPEDEITNVANTIRWEPRMDRNPPAIILIRRGKERKTIATISQDGAYASLYQSWKPIIESWRLERATNGNKRTKHEKFGVGASPSG